MIVNGFFGNDWGGDILISAGYNVQVIGGIHTACVTTSCKEVTVGSAATGDITLNGVQMSGAATGVEVDSGSNVSIKNSQIFGMTTAAVNVAANVSGFSVIGNELGSSTNSGTNANAVTVQPGSSDHYNIIGNLVSCASAGVTDGGSGTHKTITGNN